MARYSVEFKPSVWKDLDHVPKSHRKRILDRIRKLGDDPHPPGSQKLASREAYRVRQGNYRIIYTIENDRLVVIVVKIGHRGQVYDR